MARIAVVGAGIAGLGAAYQLQKAGHHVVVLERGGTAGGRMLTQSQDGFTWDCGPQFMLTSYTYMQALMDELGVSRSPYPIAVGQAIVLPGGRRFYGSASPFSVLQHPALSFRTKLRLWKVLKAASQHRSLFDFHRPEKVAPIDVESLRTWGDREIGRDAVDYLLSLPTSSLFFWTAEETPWWFPAFYATLMQQHKVFVPAGGMGAVPQALAKRLDVRLHTRVERVTCKSDGVSLSAVGTGGAEEFTVDRVVLATPAPVTLGMLADPDAVLGKVRADYLRTATYVSNTTTAVAYRKAPETKAYGVGLPLALNHRLAAIGWEQMKGRDRVPEGAGLGVMMPTHDQTARLWNLPNDQIGTEMVEAAESIYPGSRQDALFTRVYHWRYAMPVLPHGRYAQMARAKAATPSQGTAVFTCGDYWGGPDTERALQSGIESAAQVLRSLS